MVDEVVDHLQGIVPDRNAAFVAGILAHDIRLFLQLTVSRKYFHETLRGLYCMRGKGSVVRKQHLSSVTLLWSISG
ncbi:hypothetical protein DPMN_096804 [Dreissena polymorpha]|uniref:Uncharacterized protein n=1 Tax=Dreissena polymorpha TaxID=45954 RepID=A0A9D4R402_DREPO|nr:hypothetical protein DPMN_096804 [Dreissena polymorpha]